MRIILRLYELALLLALTTTAAAVAQLPTDIQLSPIEPVRSQLPAEYRIESAAQKGDRTLIAWVTSRSVARDSIAGELHAQIAEGRRPVGARIVLTGEGAHPASFLRVLPLGSDFLIVWNDSRSDAAGIYAMVLDTLGAVVIGERRLGPPAVRHGVFGIRVFAAGQSDGGYQLFWHVNDGARTWTTGLRIASDGTLSDAKEIGHILHSIRRFAAKPDIWFLQFDSSAVVVNGDGAVAEGEANSALGNDMFLPDDDLSILRLKGATLERYASPFTEGPTWGVTVPFPDSVISGSGTFGQDSTGSYSIIYATESITGTQSSSGWFILEFWKRRFSIADGSFADSVELLFRRKEINGQYSHPNGALLRVAKASSEIGCDRSARTVFDIERREIYHGDLTAPSRTEWTVSVSPSGAFRETSVGFRDDCFREDLHVSRDSSATDLTIVWEATRDTLHLEAPVASYAIEVAQQRPKLLAGAGDVPFLCWGDEEGREIVARLPRLLETAVPFDTLTIPLAWKMVETTPNASFGILAAGPQASSRISRTTRTGAVILDNQLFYADVRSHPTSSTERLGNTSLTVGIPGDGGWISVQEGEWTRDFGITLRFGDLLGMSADGEFVIGVFSTYWDGNTIVPTDLAEVTPPHSIYRFGRDGTVRFAGVNLDVTEPGFWMPLGTPNRFLVVQRDAGLVVQAGTIISEFPLAAAVGRQRVVPLDVGRFLRLRETGIGMIAIDMHDTAGRVLAEGEVVDSSYDLFDTEHTSIIPRSSDSAVAVLWRTKDDGVHGMLLNQALQVIVRDTVLSATRDSVGRLSGLFVGDLLVCAWEDFREDGYADIYGNMILFPSAPVTDTASDLSASAPGAAARISVYPNPARDIVRVRFSTRTTRNSILQVTDMAGREVRRESVFSGSEGLSLHVGSLPTGLYRLEWTSDTIRVGARIVVVH